MPTHAELPFTNSSFHDSNSWTDALPVCRQSAVGSSTNQIYREDGNRQEAHPYEDFSCRVKYDHEKNDTTTFLYGVFDGEEGTQAASFALQRMAAEILLDSQLSTSSTDEEIREILKCTLSCVFLGLSYRRQGVEYCNPWTGPKFGLFSSTSSIEECRADKPKNERSIWLMNGQYTDGSKNSDLRAPEGKVDDNQLKTVVEANSSETTLQLAAGSKVTIPTTLGHLKAIGQIKELNPWVPHELSEHHQRILFEAYCSLVSRLRSDPFLH